MSYYIDKRSNEIIKDLDIGCMAPEMYCKYLCGESDFMIKETWFVGNGKVIDFCWSIPLNASRTDIERDLHFKKFGVKPLYLISYTVPEHIYNEIARVCSDGEE